MSAELVTALAGVVALVLGVASLALVAYVAVSRRVHDPSDAPRAYVALGTLALSVALVGVGLIVGGAGVAIVRALGLGS